MLEIDFSMPQLPPPPPHNPCLASPRPCPGYVQNKPAGKSKIQLNKSKIQLKKSDLIEQIKNLYQANPKQHLNKSKISVGQIPKLLWTNLKWKRNQCRLWPERYRTGRKGFFRRLVVCLCVCCHFPTISSTMKPWLVSHVIKTCLPRSTCVANWTMTHNIPRTNSIQIFLGEKKNNIIISGMILSITEMMKDTIVSVIMIMRIMMIMVMIIMIMRLRMLRASMKMLMACTELVSASIGICDMAPSSFSFASTHHHHNHGWWQISLLW